jgi:hypothetical protein
MGRDMKSPASRKIDAWGASDPIWEQIYAPNIDHIVHVDVFGNICHGSDEES